jgi:uncharacterized membrane protein YphA (DoxX/SURF4 family)
MPAFITFGRFLFAVLFIVSGVSKLLDITATADVIRPQLAALPEVLKTYSTQVETMTGMLMPQILAIVAGTVELLCGLLIALNFGARFFAIVLILFVIVATYYQHDFWNQTGEASRNNMIHALKNLSLIGALFIIAGIGRGPRVTDPTYTDA